MEPKHSPESPGGAWKAVLSSEASPGDWETQGLKDSITILRAGTAHSRRDGENRQHCSPNFPGHSVHAQTHTEINEKQSDQIVKRSHLDSRKQDLVSLLRSEKVSRWQMLGQDQAKCSHPTI